MKYPGRALFEYPESDTMRIAYILALTALVAVASCRKAPNVITINEEEPGSPNPHAIMISTGTSFGECAGYCRTALAVEEGGTLRFVESSWDTLNYPLKLQSGTLVADQLACLRAAVERDSAAFRRLDSVIGCPDCADGGAEWIEITHGGTTKRVTFEYGKTIPAIERLQDAMRLLRGNYKPGAYLYQTWDWVQSVGGLAGETLTPATTGYHKRAIFRSDGSYELYRNDSLAVATTYKLNWIKLAAGVDGTVVTYANNDMGQEMTIRGDTLILQDQCSDCYEHTWIRATAVCNK
jgi:hypothetical protein